MDVSMILFEPQSPSGLWAHNHLESVAMIFANFAVAGALLPVKSIGG